MNRLSNKEATITIQVKMTPSFRDHIRKRAQELQLKNMSYYIRHLITRDLTGEKP